MNEEMTECVDISSAVGVKTTKICTKCGEEKEFDNFYKAKREKYGIKSKCKKCYNALNAKYMTKYSKKPEVKERQKKYNQSPKAKKRQREYYLKPEIKKIHRIKTIKYLNNKRKTDPIFRMNKTISGGLYQSLKSKGLSKNGRHWEDLVGWTQQEFIDYITPLFCKKIVDKEEVIMTWENYGKEWQIDHIYPKSLCGDTEANVIYNWRIENLQPLWKEDNLEKKDRLDWVKDESKYILLSEKGIL